MDSPLQQQQDQQCYHEKRWNFMYQRLAFYLRQHGNLRVQRLQNRELYGWMTVQRVHYHSQTSLLTRPRIDKLNQLGFDWKHKNSHDNNCNNHRKRAMSMEPRQRIVPDSIRSYKQPKRKNDDSPRRAMESGRRSTSSTTRKNDEAIRNETNDIEEKEGYKKNNKWLGNVEICKALKPKPKDPRGKTTQAKTRDKLLTTKMRIIHNSRQVGPVIHLPKLASCRSSRLREPRGSDDQAVTQPVLQPYNVDLPRTASNHTTMEPIIHQGCVIHLPRLQPVLQQHIENHRKEPNDFATNAPLPNAISHASETLEGESGPEQQLPTSYEARGESEKPTELEKQNSELLAKLEQNQVELWSSRGQIDELSKSLEAAQSQVRSHEETMDQLKKKSLARIFRLSQAQESTISGLRAALAEKDKKQEELQARATMRVENYVKIVVLQDQLAKVRSALTQEQKTRDVWRSRYERLQVEYEEAEELAAKHVARTEMGYREQIQRMRHENQALRGKIKELQRKMAPRVVFQEKDYRHNRSRRP